VISQHWWAFLAFALVAGLLNLLGTLCCVVGAFVTIPWGLIAFAYLYEDRFGPKAISGTGVASPAA
jgi:hypothetical protein